MTCWSNMSVNRNNRRLAVILVDKLFGYPNTVPADALDVAVSTVTVDTISQNVTRTLLSEYVVDQALVDELDALVRYPQTQPDLA